MIRRKIIPIILLSVLSLSSSIAGTPGSIMSVAEKFSSDSLYKYIENTLPSVKWIGNSCRMKEVFYGL